MILYNIPDPNLVIEYLRALIDTEASFDELKDLMTSKAYKLSAESLSPYSDVITMICTEVKIKALRGHSVDDLIAWINSLKQVQDIYPVRQEFSVSGSRLI